MKQKNVSLAFGLLCMQACSMPTYVFNQKENVLYANAHNPIIITGKHFHIDTDNGKLIKRDGDVYIIPEREGACKISVRHFRQKTVHDFSVRQIDTSREKLAFYLGPRAHFETYSIDNFKKKTFLIHTWDSDYEIDSKILEYRIIVQNETDTILSYKNIGKEFNTAVIEALSKLNTKGKIIIKDIKLGFDNSNTVTLHRHEIFQ